MESRGNEIQFSLCSKKITTSLKFVFQRIYHTKIKTRSDNQKLNILGLITILFINFHKLLLVILLWIAEMNYINMIVLSYVYLYEN